MTSQLNLSGEHSGPFWSTRKKHAMDRPTGTSLPKKETSYQIKLKEDKEEDVLT